MNYSVNATWIKGTVGWLLANATGKFTYMQHTNYTVWYFENGEDATAFKLRFGL